MSIIKANDTVYNAFGVSVRIRISSRNTKWALKNDVIREFVSKARRIRQRSS